MILATVGTDLPFSRLVERIDLWSKVHPGERVVAQIGRLGPLDYVPKSVEWTEMVPADRLDGLYNDARLIVAHAGMGSIITALSMAKPIVILPRLARLGEHRNDHQLATARRFADRPGIFVAWSEAELPGAIARALAAPATTLGDRLPQFAPPEFTGRLRDFILHHRRPPL